jgi:16S rRNA (guanine1516-N2)-methyltransferase
MLVTTSYKPSEAAIHRAERIAGMLGCGMQPRQRLPLHELRTRYNEKCIVVVTDDDIKVHCHDLPPLFFHPSTGLVRIKRLLNGEPDTVVQISELEAGDSVLDCTAGLGSDSIVFSHAVGPAGKVTALESNQMIWLLLHEGLKHYVSDVPEVNAAMRRIEVPWRNHIDYLSQLPDRSVDIVFFDPMFDRPIQESSAMAPIRQFANHTPLSKEAIEHALRVARKTVIMKEHRDSAQFARLGFKDIKRTYSKIAYGVIKA